MRPLRTLVAGVLLMCALPLWAAQTGRDCEMRAKQIPAGKREAFLQSCLKQASALPNVQAVAEQNRRRTCEQNAQNLKLNPGNKPGYVAECLHKNEAALAARKLGGTSPVRTPATVAAAPAQNNERPVQTKPTATGKRQACIQQAQERALKGAARKRFLRQCRAG